MHHVPMVKLKYLADFNPPVPSGIRGSTETFPIFPMEKIISFGKLEATVDYRPVKELLAGYTYLEPTDVAYAKVTPCFENGKGILGSDLDGPSFATTELTVLRPKPGVDQRYLSYLLQTPEFMEKAISSMTGAGGLKRVSEEFVKQLKFPLPGLSKQQEIADVLDRELAAIDGLIADQQRLQGLLQERLVSLTFDLATDASNPDRYETDHPFWKTLPKGWTLQKLGWHFKIGNGSTPSTENPDYWTVEDNGFPWFNSSIVNFEIAVEPARYVTAQAIRECHLPVIPQNSLLVGLTGQGKTRGMVTKTGIDSTINQHIAFLTPRPNSQIYIDFAQLALKAAYPELRFLSDSNGGTKGALTCEELKNFKIPAPLIGDQEKTFSKYIQFASENNLLMKDLDKINDIISRKKTAVIKQYISKF